MLANGFALYWRLIGQSIRAQLQYRLSFCLMTLGGFVANAVEAVGLWALFDRFAMLGQWTLPQVAFLYGLVNCVFAFTEALTRGFDVFGTEFVRTGEFDRVLLRPRTTVLQLAGFRFQLHRIGRFLQGLIVLVWAIWMLDLDWTPARGMVFAAAVMGGVAFFAGLFIIQATLCFWATESLELMNTLTYGGVETATFPLAIYRRWFRRFFTFVVPLGCISYFPALFVFGIDDPLGTGAVFQALTPLAGFAFLGLALAAWRVGIRHYTSTGS